MPQDSSFCSRGLCLEKTIWKWPLHQRDRCWKQLRTWRRGWGVGGGGQGVGGGWWVVGEE